MFARCDQRSGCKSRLWIRTDGRLLHLLQGEHNHAAQPWRPDNAKVKQRQMELVASDTDLVITVLRA
jgi:hypothetical protein